MKLDHRKFVHCRFPDEDFVEFSPTFIGMTETKEIHLVNNSEDATFFEWLPIELIHESSDLFIDSSSKYIQIFPMVSELI